MDTRNQIIQDIVDITTSLRVEGGGSSSKYGSGMGGRVYFDKNVSDTLRLSPYIQGYVAKPKDQDVTGSVTGFGLEVEKKFNKGSPPAGLTEKELASVMENENVKKFMNIIGTIESDNQYDVIVGGEKFTDYSKHPSKIGARTKAGPSTAAGKYQFVETTFEGLKNNNPQIKIKDFSPDSQDKAFVLLLKEQRVLDDVLKGGYGFTKAIERLGSQFASLPSSPYKDQPKVSYDYLNKQFGVPFPEIKQVQVKQDPVKLSEQEIRSSDLSLLQNFQGPGTQPSSYDIAAALTYLSDNQTKEEVKFLEDAGVLLPEPSTGKKKSSITLPEFFYEEKTPLDEMILKQEPRNREKGSPPEGEKKEGFSFKLPKGMLIGDDIVEIPEDEREVTLTVNDLENLADAASLVPIPQVKFPAKAAKGIMSLLKLDKIDPFLQKDYLEKLQKEYLKDHMDDALGLTYVQNKLAKVFPGFQVKPKKKLKIDLFTDELYDPLEPSMGKMRTNLSKEDLMKDIQLSAQVGKGLAKRDIGNEPYILNPMEDYQLSKKEKDFIKKVVRKNYPDFGVKSDASTMASPAIEQSYDRLFDFISNKLRRKSMGIGKFYKQKEIEDQFTDTVLDEALKEIDSITKFRDQRKVDSVFSELMKRQQGK